MDGGGAVGGRAYRLRGGGLELRVSVTFFHQVRELERRGLPASEKTRTRKRAGPRERKSRNLCRGTEPYHARLRSVNVGRYSFETWEEYLETRWDLSQSYVSRLMDTAVAASKLENHANWHGFRESHFRPLLSLKSDEDRAAKNPPRTRTTKAGRQ